MMNVQDFLDEVETDFLNTKEVTGYNLTFWHERAGVTFQIWSVTFDDENQSVEFSGRIVS